MKKNILTLISLLLIATFALAACGAPATEAPAQPAAPAEPAAPAAEEPAAPAPAVEADGKLVIWADDTRAPVLQRLAPQVLETYNLQLDVVLKSDIRDDFQVAAPVGEGPDIIVIAHDQAGALVANGLLAEVDLGDKADLFSEVAKGACTFDGVLYCMPYATENMGFFYNTDLVDSAPATWDEVIAIGEALKAEGKVTYVMAVTGATYDLYPIFTSFGGYIFGRTATGDWNDQDLGIDSPGMIAAAAFMRENVENGNFPSDWDWANNHALFETGEAAFIMAGPWALDRIGESGIPYAVAEQFPAGPAGPGAPFAGTQGMFISSQSENILLAQAFLTEFVASDEVMMELYRVGNRPSAYLPVLDMTDNPDLLAMGRAGANAVMMPAIPAMGAVWGNWESAITLVRNGTQDAETALTEAGEKIRAVIDNALAGMVNVPGSYQEAAGCPGSWSPDCEVTAMTEDDDGLWRSGPFELPAGEYAFKVAMDGSWTLNYGVDGAEGGDDYSLTLDADSSVTFIFDPETNLLTWEVE